MLISVYQWKNKTHFISFQNFFIALNLHLNLSKTQPTLSKTTQTKATSDLALSSRRYPRINRESLLPIAKNMRLSGENGEAWYPPGHGDIYASFSNSGLLDQLIAEGKEYIFVSNIDNLGATVDLFILNQLMSQPADKRCEFVMEVTDKTRADVKVAWLPAREHPCSCSHGCRTFRSMESSNIVGLRLPAGRYADPL